MTHSDDSKPYANACRFMTGDCARIVRAMARNFGTESGVIARLPGRSIGSRAFFVALAVCGHTMALDIAGVVVDLVRRLLSFGIVEACNDYTAEVDRVTYLVSICVRQLNGGLS